MLIDDLKKKVLLINFIESAILSENFVIYEFSLKQTQLNESMNVLKYFKISQPSN